MTSICDQCFGHYKSHQLENNASQKALFNDSHRKENNLTFE